MPLPARPGPRSFYTNHFSSIGPLHIPIGIWRNGSLRTSVIGQKIFSDILFRWRNQLIPPASPKKSGKFCAFACLGGFHFVKLKSALGCGVRWRAGCGSGWGSLRRLASGSEMRWRTDFRERGAPRNFLHGSNTLYSLLSCILVLWRFFACLGWNPFTNPNPNSVFSFLFSTKAGQFSAGLCLLWLQRLVPVIGGYGHWDYSVSLPGNVLALCPSMFTFYWESTFVHQVKKKKWKRSYQGMTKSVVNFHQGRIYSSISNTIM
jgi:hypothetical protein